MTVLHVMIVALIAMITTVAQAQPLPLPKTVPCPSGYRESGGYCAPMNDKAPVAVPKVGPCPSGWMQSGNYCVDMRRSLR